MKEVFLTKGCPKWMPFHLIFFKNEGWLILPCIAYVHKNKAQYLGSEIVFGWFRGE